MHGIGLYLLAHWQRPHNSLLLCHVPAQDVADDDEEGNGTRLHGTAVAQVLAFILQALRDDLPPEAWHDDLSHRNGTLVSEGS